MIWKHRIAGCFMRLAAIAGGSLFATGTCDFDGFIIDVPGWWYVDGNGGGDGEWEWDDGEWEWDD